MQFGDVLLLDYPFTDASGSKRRPGLVLLPEADGDVLFARITSKEREGEFDLALEDWKSAGLAYPSMARLARWSRSIAISFCARLVVFPSVIRKTSGLSFASWFRGSEKFRFWIPAFAGMRD